MAGINDFNPDDYLRENGVDLSGFDPDEYLKAMAPPEPPQAAPQPQESRMFPMASQVQGNGMGASAKRVGLGALDLMGAPTRALAASTTDQKMSDPDAYAMKPLVEKFHSVGGPEAPDTRPADMPMFGNKVDFKDMARHLDSRDASGAGDTWAEIMGRIASDPAAYLGPLTKLLGLAPKAVTAASKVAGAVNRGTGKLAQAASGVPEEALRAYGDKGMRAKMADNFGREHEIGREVLENIDNPDQYLPERAQIDAALGRMGDMPLKPVLDAMEQAKGGAVAGRLSPEKGAANAGIDKYIKFLRGGEIPEDLAETAQRAGSNLEDARTNVAALGPQAKADARDAARALREQKAAQSEVGKIGAEIKGRKQHGTDFGWWHDETMQGAQEAAQKARQAAESARARQAVGGISKADFEAAQAAEQSAQRAAVVADAASRIYKGEPLKQVAEDLTRKHGLGVDDLRDVLAKARDKAKSVPDAPDQTVSAREYRDLRRDLDVPIKWDEEGAGIKNRALMAGRTTMKNELIRKAEESGDPEYAELMRSWSKKLDLLERVKGQIGANASTRDARIERFVGTLFGKNTKYKQQLMADLDEVFQSDVLGRAKAADMAKKLGPEGKPAILPVYGTGGSVNMAVNSAMVLPKAIATLATLGTASPRMAATVTLPMLTKLEEGLKAAGIAMTPKAANAMNALKKATTDAQKARLASILAAELESQMPANALPFRQKVAEEDEMPYPAMTRR